jgi:nucleotide-binding universal stress UspA family protein
MYKHVLAPTDGSPLSLKALKTAARLASAMHARVTVLHVMHPYVPPMESEAAIYYPGYSAKGYEREIRKVTDKLLAKAGAVFESEKVRHEAASEFGTSPWESIVANARKRKCDLIVMASHGRRGLMGVLLGSETQKVLTHSKVPVLVCR